MSVKCEHENKSPLIFACIVWFRVCAIKVTKILHLVESLSSCLQPFAINKLNRLHSSLCLYEPATFTSTHFPSPM